MNESKRGNVIPLVAKMLPLLFLVVSLGCGTTKGQTAAETVRDYELFICAIEKQSTAPLYVLVTVMDSRTGLETEEAITANLLLGAIHREYDFPFTEDGVRQAVQLAKARHDRRFSFSNPLAIENVKPRYTAAILLDVRNHLSGVSDEDVVAAVSLERELKPSLMDSIYEGHETESSAYRDAIAHVLLERHILCGVSDLTGGLYIERRPCGGR